MQCSLMRRIHLICSIIDIFNLILQIILRILDILVLYFIIIILKIIEIIININLNITIILNRKRYNALEIEINNLSFELDLFI